MATVDELWQMSTDLYARAQSSDHPKQRLMRMAYDYLKQAEEMRRSRTVIQAKYPNPDRKIG